MAPIRALIGYAGTMFGSACLNNLWVTYYVYYYMKVLKVSDSAFYIAQIIYMIWNCLNDPLFGWLSDLSKGKRRTPKILWGGLGWSITFFLSWFSFELENDFAKGIHCILALCCYDGFLTLVELNHQSLLAEITIDARQRSMFHAASSMGAVVGSLSSFLGSMYWNESDLRAFHFVCGGASIMAAIGFILTGVLVGERKRKSRRNEGWTTFGLEEEEEVGGGGDNQQFLEVVSTTTTTDGDDQQQQQQQHRRLHHHDDENNKEIVNRIALQLTGQEPAVVVDDPSSSSSSALEISNNNSSLPPIAEQQQQQQQHESSISSSSTLNHLHHLRLFVSQLASHKNFLRFAMVNAIQVFECTFEKNFLFLFLSSLVANIGNKGISATIGASFIIPHFLTVVFTPAIAKFGLYNVIRSVLSIKLLVCLVALVLPFRDGVAVACFAVTARILTESVCRLSPLVLCDLVDEDQYLHKRFQTMSASVIGSDNLLVKPGQSLAPILGWYLMSKMQINGNDNKNIVDPGDLDFGMNGGGGGGVLNNANMSTMFSILVLLPMCCITLQSILWTRYTLKGKYLKDVKAAVAKMAQEDAYAV